MSQTAPQHAAAPAKLRPRKDWELFWRIIAGLMMLTIAWVAWVLYQITPRSVVTPLVYETQIKRGGIQSSESRTAVTVTLTPAMVAATLRMDQAQAALRSGAHEPSADVQAAGLGAPFEPEHGERLKLSTEIMIPPVEKQTSPQQREAKPDSAPPVPAATAGKARP